MKGLVKVCVCGLGTVGLPTAQYIQKRNFKTWGYDVREVKGEIKAFTNWDQVPNVDIYVITVNTSSVPDICRRIAERNKGTKDALVCIESTVPVGTCRKVAERHGLKSVAHCPHRYWRDEPVEHGVRQLRVLGALNDDSLRRAEEFYRKLDIPIHVVPSIEIAELTKIAENCHRYVEIAFAEELCRICGKLNLDFDTVRRAINTKWNTEVLEARNGIKRTCLPKDIDLLRQITFTPLLDGAVKTDSVYRKGVK